METQTNVTPTTVTSPAFHTSNKHSYETRNKEQTNYSANTYRFNISNELKELIINFVRNHRFDTTEEFQKSWEEFIDYNDEIIIQERNMLKANGYNGCVDNKLYKSARFYYLNKVLQEKKSVSECRVDPPIRRIINTDKQGGKMKRKYTTVSDDFKDCIDAHIEEIVARTSNKSKPSECYEDFCLNNVEKIKDEINLLIAKGFETGRISNKFKKTYKNRFFNYQKRTFSMEEQH